VAENTNKISSTSKNVFGHSFVVAYILKSYLGVGYK